MMSHHQINVRVKLNQFVCNKSTNFLCCITSFHSKQPALTKICEKFTNIFLQGSWIFGQCWSYFGRRVSRDAMKQRDRLIWCKRYMLYRVALNKTPTDIHPHKMARNCPNVGIIGLDLVQINFFRKNPVAGLPDLFRPSNAMLSQNVRF